MSLQREYPQYFKYWSDSVPEDAPTTIHDFIKYIADTCVGHEISETAENEGAGLVLMIKENTRVEGTNLPSKIVVSV